MPSLGETTVTGFVTITSFTAVCVLSDLIYSTRDTYSTYTHCANENEEKITQKFNKATEEVSLSLAGGAQSLVFGRHFQANSPKKL